MSTLDLFFLDTSSFLTFFFLSYFWDYNTITTFNIPSLPSNSLIVLSPLFFQFTVLLHRLLLHAYTCIWLHISNITCSAPIMSRACVFSTFIFDGINAFWLMVSADFLCDATTAIVWSSDIYLLALVNI